MAVNGLVFVFHAPEVFEGGYLAPNPFYESLQVIAIFTEVVVTRGQDQMSNKLIPEIAVFDTRNQTLVSLAIAIYGQFRPPASNRRGGRPTLRILVGLNSRVLAADGKSAGGDAPGPHPRPRRLPRPPQAGYPPLVAVDGSVVLPVAIRVALSAKLGKPAD